MTACKTKFKVGDFVYAPFHGYGTVSKILDEHCVYPVIVTWDPEKIFMETSSSFTADGYLTCYDKSDNLKLTVIERRHKHRTLLNRFRAFLKGE